QKIEDRLTVFEEIRKTAEEKYIENPTDVDNLTRWGGALLELSQYGTMDESKKKLRGAVSRLLDYVS
ncbi:mitochondrial import receptor subunit TOM20-like protein, partial [Tanacetum coccineum]